MKTCPLTSDDRALIRVLWVEKGWQPNSPDLNQVDYSIWGALQQLIYHRCSIRKNSCKPAGSRLVKTLSIVL